MAPDSRHALPPDVQVGVKPVADAGEVGEKAEQVLRLLVPILGRFEEQRTLRGDRRFALEVAQLGEDLRRGRDRVKPPRPHATSRPDRRELDQRLSELVEREDGALAALRDQLLGPLFESRRTSERWGLGTWEAAVTPRRVVRGLPSRPGLSDHRSRRVRPSRSYLLPGRFRAYSTADREPKKGGEDV